MTDVGVRSIYIYVNNTYLRPMKSASTYLELTCKRPARPDNALNVVRCACMVKVSTNTVT